MLSIYSDDAKDADNAEDADNANDSDDADDADNAEDAEYSFQQLLKKTKRLVKLSSEKGLRSECLANYN
jgi:hypothetical protein